jgi:orotidine-5'-phosphate decarboxylase
MTNPVYVGIDTGDLARAESLGRAVAPHVGGLKLGLEFFMAQGPDGVRRIADIGLPIFLDVKLHDIPNTVAGALRSLAPLGVGIVNVHAQGGHAMMAAARDACPTTTKVIGVTVLTSLDAADLGREPFAEVARLAAMSRSAGLDGVVCSGLEVAALKRDWTDGLFVVPGIRPAGSDTGDQKRVMTPRNALDAGASVLVIGRPITGAADPARAAAEIAESLA